MTNPERQRWLITDFVFLPLRIIALWRFEEFENKIHQIMFVSATPGPYEAEHEQLKAQQVIRPTGLLDPKVEVRPSEGQIDDLLNEIRHVTEKKQKTLITTLTKKMAEDLTKYLQESGVKVQDLHSDIDTLERLEIVRDLRTGCLLCPAGINLSGVKVWTFRRFP